MKNITSHDVTAVIPMYNSGNSCIRAIDSILKQTCPVYEIIVVDDGSADDCAKSIGKHFHESEIPIHVYRIENRGAAGARNFGLSLVKTELVAFLDSDDCWLPHKTECQLEIFNEHQDLCLIGSLTNMPSFSPFGKITREGTTLISLRRLLFKNHFQTSTVIAKRGILLACEGFPEGRRYAEEGDLFMKIAALHKCILVNEVLVDYSEGKPGFGVSGLSANLWRMEQGELINIIAVRSRGDASSWLITIAICFSILKFFRRLYVRLISRLAP